MLKYFVIFTAMLSTIFSANALQIPNSNILPHGSVANCREPADAGLRSYKLLIKEVSTTTLTLQVDTLICLRLEGVMTFVPFALAEKQVYKNNGHIISYENSEASLSIADADATTALTRLTLNPHKFSQDVILDTQSLRARIFDASLQFLEIISIDGKVVDQGLRTNGTYRITLN